MSLESEIARLNGNLEKLIPLLGNAPAAGKPDAFAEAAAKIPAEKPAPAKATTPKPATKPAANKPKAEPAPEPEPAPEEEEEVIDDVVEDEEPVTYETLRAWHRDGLAAANAAGDTARAAAIKAAYPATIRKFGGEKEGKPFLPGVPEEKLGELYAALIKAVG